MHSTTASKLDTAELYGNRTAGDTWQCEVKEEPDLWKDQILRVVGKRADELQDLMRVDTQPQTVREWLDSL